MNEDGDRQTLSDNILENMQKSGHAHPAGARALAQAQEQGAALVLGLQGHEQDPPGPLQGSVGHGAQSRAGLLIIVVEKYLPVI